jgi:hypothetical protein
MTITLYFIILVITTLTLLSFLTVVEFVTNSDNYKSVTFDLIFDSLNIFPNNIIIENHI